MPEKVNQFSYWITMSLCQFVASKFGHLINSRSGMICYKHDTPLMENWKKNNFKTVWSALKKLSVMTQQMDSKTPLSTYYFRKNSCKVWVQKNQYVYKFFKNELTFSQGGRRLLIKVVYDNFTRLIVVVVGFFFFVVVLVVVVLVAHAN